MKFLKLAGLAGLALVMGAGGAQASPVSAGKKSLGKKDAGKAQPVRPVSQPGTWITSDDYPEGAGNGRTAFRLDVGKDGSVTGCHVTASSGSAVLDQATCRLVSQRATFHPALDAQGRPLNGVYTSAVVWNRDDLRDHPEAGEMTQVIDVNADGTIASCTMPVATGAFAKTRESIISTCMTIRMHPFLDKDGNPVPRRVTIHHETKIEPVPAS